MPTVVATVGGKGSRLYPLTLKQPKPLVSMCGMPILSRSLETLANQGCREFVLAVKGAMNTLRIKDFFGDGKGFSKILNLPTEAVFRYQPNYPDKGSADALRNCMRYFDLNDDVVVISGDNIINIDLEKWIDYHQEKGAVLTVGLWELPPEEDISKFGVAQVDSELRIKGFIEKPPPGKEPSRLINTSIYIFSPKIRDIFEEMGDSVRDIGYNVIPYLVDHGYPVRGIKVEGYWADVGTPGVFYRAVQDMLYNRISRIEFDSKQLSLSSLVHLKQNKNNVFIHSSSFKHIRHRIDREVIIGDYVNIGRDCKLGNGVEVASSCIGDNCVVGENSKITNSIVMDFTNIGKNVRLNRCIIGRYVTIQDESIIDEDLDVAVRGPRNELVPVIGDGVTVLKGSIIGPAKRVAPINESHHILSSGIYQELGYDNNNIYFIEK